MTNIVFHTPNYYHNLYIFNKQHPVSVQGYFLCVYYYSVQFEPLNEKLFLKLCVNTFFQLQNCCMLCKNT